MIAAKGERRMLRSMLLGGAAAVATSAAALAQQPPPPPSPRAFAQTAASADQYEITAAQVAVTQTTNPRVRAFANEMIADHTRLRDALRQAVAASNLPPPDPGVGADNAPLLAALQSLTGPAFDRAYLKQQVLAHKEALILEQGYAAQGSDANLRQAAQASVPVIQHHLEMAEQLRAALGGS